MALKDGTTARKLIIASVEPLALIYERAYRDLIFILSSEDISKASHSRKILSQVKDIVKTLDKETQKYLENKVPKIYREFHEEIKTDISASGAIVSKGFSKIHEEAVQNLVTNARLTFGETMAGVTRDAQRVVNTARRDAIRNIIGSGQIRGAEVANDVKKYLKEEGIVSMVDKGGKKWTLDRYSRMLTQEVLAQTAREAQYNTAQEYGFDLVKITSHGAKDACKYWEGKIMSLTGETKGYPTLDKLKSSKEIFHIGCRHSYFVIVSPTEVQEASSKKEANRLEEDGAISNYEARKNGVAK